ncbi:MAG: S8 family serine peptidase [Actinomycetota bacterium]|nr:S8 family serine peptidase [Actinomycetota bacterium]
MRKLSILLVVALLASACAGTEVGPDPFIEEQYALDLMDLPEAWETATGKGVVIAIIDTGVDLDHPDLKSKLERGRDFVDGDREPQDENGHGTHVAGIAAAIKDNGIGITGAAPDARILPVRVLNKEGVGDGESIAEAIRWATENGADVINLSLGGSSDLLGRLFKNGPSNDAIREADAAGVVVVAAAGNDATFIQAYRTDVPVIVVNASNELDLPAGFTNFGDPRAITAPGARILSTAPSGSTEIWPDGSEGYEAISGTSMATPYVAGVAALLVELGLTPAEIRDILVQTTDDPNAVFVLSAGRINAAAAVQAASGS